MTRDELIDEISEEVKKVLPENLTLDGDDLDTVISTVNDVVNDACAAIDAADEEEGTEEPAKS